MTYFTKINFLHATFKFFSDQAVKHIFQTSMRSTVINVAIKLFLDYAKTKRTIMLILLCKLFWKSNVRIFR